MPTEAPPAPSPRATSTAGIRSPDPASAIARERAASPRVGRVEAPPVPTGPTPDDSDGKPNADRVAALRKSWALPDEPPAKPKTDDPPRPGAEELATVDDPTKTDEIVPRGTKQDDKVPEPAVDKRKNPWKLYDEEKKARTNAETELQKLKGERVTEQERTTLVSRAEKAEARNKELEDNLRFKDYENSKEFEEKYRKPYVDVLAGANEFLSRIPVVDAATGERRAANQDDLFKLMALDPIAADAKALELFQSQGLADRVIALGDRVGAAFNECKKALDAEKTNGATRVQQEKIAKAATEKVLAKEISDFAKQVYAEQLADPKIAADIDFIKIQEGKQPTPEEKAHNDALSRGYDQVKKYMVLKPQDAKTPEERQEIIKNLIAIGNRSAAFGPMKQERNRLRARVKELEEDIAEYEGTAPKPPGERARGGGGAAPQENVMDSFEQNLRRRSAR